MAYRVMTATFIGMVLFSPYFTFAHPGKVDSSGGHHDRKHGGYHYHGGGGSSRPATGSSREASSFTNPSTAGAGIGYRPSESGAQVYAPSGEGTGGDMVMGNATVHDGDSLEIMGRKIRLYGIDAPELGQTCEAQGQTYDCGQAALQWLGVSVQGENVVCNGRGVDKYGRLLAVCKIKGVELNAAIVQDGLALAFRKYSMDYVRQEEAAQKAQRGLWKGSFDPPWEWRKQHK